MYLLSKWSVCSFLPVYTRCLVDLKRSTGDSPETGSEQGRKESYNRNDGEMDVNRKKYAISSSVTYLGYKV